MQYVTSIMLLVASRYIQTSFIHTMSCLSKECLYGQCWVDACFCVNFVEIYIYSPNKQNEH